MAIVERMGEGAYKAHGIPWDELRQVDPRPRKLGGDCYALQNRWAALALYRYASPAVQDELFLDRLEVELSRALELPGGRTFRHPPEEALYPYQKAGIQYALQRPHTLFGDEPGLGKTSQAIVTANESGAGRVLVVCPAAVRLQWADQIVRWAWPRNAPTPSGLPVVNTVLKGTDGIYQGKLPSWTIISYDLIVRSRAIQEAIARREFEFAILDEVHYLKSFEAQRTRALFGHPDVADDNGLVGETPRVLGLTGTPLPNRPRECYAVARTMNWGAIGHLAESPFRGRYNPSILMANGFCREEVARPWELQARLRAHFMVRRAKRAVLPQLPQVSWDILRLEPNAEIRRVLRAEEQTGIDPLEFNASDFKAQGAIATVRREMGEAKVPLVVDHVKRLFDGGEHKLVVFTWHREVLAQLREQLADFGVTHIQGGMTAKAAHAAKERFVQDPATRLFVGQIQSCGVGINGLQEVAQTAVFAEASWVPGDNEQAVDRLARIGQKGAVFAQFLVAPGGMDDKVLSSAINKVHGVHAALDAVTGG